MKNTNEDIKEIIKNSFELSKKRNYHGNIKKLVDYKTPEQ